MSTAIISTLCLSKGDIGSHKATPGRYKTLKGVLVSWPSLQRFMTDLKPNLKALETLRQLMAIELQEESPRPWLFDRIYMRFSNLRREYEMGLIAGMLPAMSQEEQEAA